MYFSKRFLLCSLLMISEASFSKGLFDSYVSDDTGVDTKSDNESTLLSEAVMALGGKTITKISIAGIDNKDQHKNAVLFLGLSRVLDEQITQPDYVNYLIENGVKEIKKSQQPFGYYNVDVAHQVLTKKNDQLEVVYQVNLGAPVRVKDVSVAVQGPGKKDPEFKALETQILYDNNMILNDKVYEDFKSKFNALANQKGYFDGKFIQHQILVDTEQNTAKIVLVYGTGTRYEYGKVTFKNSLEGTEQDIFADMPNHLPLSEDLLRRYVQIQDGENYNANDITQLQQDLQGSNYFKQVLIQGNPDKANQTVPVQALLTMNKKRSYLFGLGYSTDNGINGKYNYDQRWVNSKGHHFYSHLFLSQKTANFDNMYVIPAKNPITDYYYLRGVADIESDTYDNKSIYAEGGYNWQSGKWTNRVSLTQLYSKFTVGNDRDTAFVLYPTLQTTYTSTTNRLNPKTGFQVQAMVRGSAKDVGSGVSFLQGNLNIRYVQSLNEKNRLIFSVDSGAVLVSNYHKLPPKFRYFTGGDRTIRGYSYESIGPRDSSGDNVGGQYLAVGSIEYEYYFKPDWAIAAFVDAGDAFTRTFSPKYGAGLGLHWNSPVGPIKIDVAHGFDKEYGDPYRIHLSIGAELDL